MGRSLGVLLVNHYGMHGSQKIRCATQYQLFRSLRVHFYDVHAASTGLVQNIVQGFRGYLLPTTLATWVFAKGVAHWIGAVIQPRDRKSTRLNSSHGYISYAVFCLKKKKNNSNDLQRCSNQPC